MGQNGYARTYAAAVAGEAEHMFFNVTNGDFELRYIVNNGNLSIATEIFVWPERYPGGASITATSDDGSMRVDYDGQSSQVLIFPADGVKNGSHVVVKIGCKAASVIV